MQLPFFFQFAKDKEEFERTHFKIIHPPIYGSYNKNKYEWQSKESIIQSYEHIKSLVKVEINDKTKVQKVVFIKTWINDENIRRYNSLVIHHH